jgi:hypothetical protein
VITIANISRISIFGSVGSIHGIGTIDVEVWNKFNQKRRRRWEIRLSRWGADCKSVGKIELVVRAEDWFRLIIIGAFTQGGNVIELY